MSRSLPQLSNGSNHSGSLDCVAAAAGHRPALRSRSSPRVSTTNLGGFRRIGPHLLLLAWAGLGVGLSPAIDTCAAPAITVREALKQPEAWFRSEDGRSALTNVLSHQSSRGDWPKNQNTAAQQFTGDANSVKGTFDNGATTGELRLLARAINATGDEGLRAAFRKGLDHILAAQYPNGGWPRRRRWYV